MVFFDSSAVPLFYWMSRLLDGSRELGSSFAGLVEQYSSYSSQGGGSKEANAGCPGGSRKQVQVGGRVVQFAIAWPHPYM